MTTQTRPLRIRVQTAPRRGTERTVRERVREALTCPYCRDELGRVDALACERDRCGAVYHRECWEECLADYGACAVFGCQCREALPLGRVGLWVRLLRLLLAAFLFPPRIVEALRQEDSDERQALWARIRRQARLVHRETWSVQAASDATAFRFGVTSFLQIVFGVAFFVLTAWLWYVALERGGAPPFELLCGLGMLSSPAQATLLTYGLMAGLTLGVIAAKSVLLGEFAALSRADRGETVLARMAKAAKGKG